MKRALALLVAIAGVPTPARAGERSPVVTPRAAKLAHRLALPCGVEEPPRGVGMIVTGSILAFVPASLFIGFGVSIHRGTCWSVGGSCDESDEADGTGPIAIGAMFAVVGLTLLGVGIHRNQRWHKWKATQVTPRVRRTDAGTWTAGVELHF